MEGKVVVPLDGSRLAELILPHAAMLAHTIGSSLILLRVVESPGLQDPIIRAYVEEQQIWDGEVLQAQQYLRGVARREELAGLDVETVAIKGSPAEAVGAFVLRNPDVELIAMATHGRSSPGRWLLGGVAEQVLRSSPVPLLLVRPQEGGGSIDAPPARPYQVILVPLDGSSLAEQALGPAQLLVRSSGARLALVAVAPPHSDPAAPLPADRKDAHAAALRRYLAKVAEQLEQSRVSVWTHVLSSRPADGILKCALETDADLIVMAMHGRGGIGRLWPGSVAMSVAQHFQRPMLLVRAEPTARQPLEATDEARLTAAPTAMVDNGAAD